MRYSKLTSKLLPSPNLLLASSSVLVVLKLCLTDDVPEVEGWVTLALVGARSWPLYKVSALRLPSLPSNNSLVTFSTFLQLPKLRVNRSEKLRF